MADCVKRYCRVFRLVTCGLILCVTLSCSEKRADIGVADEIESRILNGDFLEANLIDSFDSLYNCLDSASRSSHLRLLRYEVDLNLGRKIPLDSLGMLIYDLDGERHDGYLSRALICRSYVLCSTRDFLAAYDDAVRSNEIAYKLWAYMTFGDMKYCLIH